MYACALCLFALQLIEIYAAGSSHSPSTSSICSETLQSAVHDMLAKHAVQQCTFHAHALLACPDDAGACPQADGGATQYASHMGACCLKNLDLMQS